jgi:glyoxylase-like metal-dependent hydrolase (beta-lactamase superfamily II)
MAAIDAVAAGVIGLRIVFVNIFAIAGEAGWTLIDGGLYRSGRRIRRWAESHFGDEPPNAIILTHAHFDHVGAVGELLDTWNVPVYAHHQELPYLTGERAYAAPDPSSAGQLLALMASLGTRRPLDIRARVHALPEDGSIPVLPGWRWVHTPGHAAGHVSLFRDEDGTLIAGDACSTAKQESLFAAVAARRPELHGPPEYGTTDWQAARESIHQLAALRPSAVAPAHGRPLAGHDAAQLVAELSERLDAIASHEHSR